MSKNLNVIVRDSNFELLRLVSQFFIVLYHIIIIWQGKEYASRPFFTSLCLPLHTGVILFVLISGYFKIRAKSKGLLKFLSIFIIYDIIEIIYNIYVSSNVIEVSRQLLFLSSSHYWFIKTYLFLYLLSPLINSYLENASRKQRWYILIVLSFMSCWMATTHGDKNMMDGKNVVLFAFLYVLGNQLSLYKRIWYKIPGYLLLTILLFFNMLLVSFMYYYAGTRTGSLLWNLSFPYSSPILIINSVLFFLFFGKLRFQSSAINNLARSSLAIYLIHSSRPFMPQIHSFLAFNLQNVISSNFFLLIAYSFYTIIVISFCIMVDKSLTPLWRVIDKVSDKVYSTLKF